MLEVNDHGSRVMRYHVGAVGDQRKRRSSMSSENRQLITFAGRRDLLQSLLIIVDRQLRWRTSPKATTRSEIVVMTTTRPARQTLHHQQPTFAANISEVKEVKRTDRIRAVRRPNRVAGNQSVLRLNERGSIDGTSRRGSPRLGVMAERRARAAVRTVNAHPAQEEVVEAENDLAVEIVPVTHVRRQVI
jgi:hypothetical protein